MGRNCCTGNLLLHCLSSYPQVDRSVDKFLPGLFSKLNVFLEQHPGGGMCSSPPFCVHRVKVTFTGEPGEGSGVLRSLFTAVGEVSVASERMGSGCG